MLKYCCWILLLLCSVYRSNGAKILGIFPTPSISHQLPFQAIMKALAARGHEITVISPDPLKKPTINHTDIDLSFSYKTFHSKFDFATMDQSSAFDLMSQMLPVMNVLVEEQLNSPALQDFIKRSNNTKYDLVFIEALMYQAYYGLVHHVGSPPVIGILSLGSIWTAADAMATPTHPAYVPDILMPFSHHMTFYQRLENTFFWLWFRYKIYGEQFASQEKIMRKYFGESPPHVQETENNLSLLMLGSSWAFNYPVPLAPSVITFHSLHVKTKPDPLPKDLQNFLDDATEGVIYFSLGSNVRSDHMPEEKISVFLEAFSQLKQKVLWKWESDSLPGQPKNVKLGKWLPQQDILAHPNIKLFITQCGLQSFQEAVFHGVPLLGIPFFGDQKYNAKKIEDLGIGLQLVFKDLTKDALLQTINTILYDPKYSQNMQKVSELSKDEPETSLNRAVWWTEYVLRHKGAKHLRSAALDLAWYQYLLLDIVAFVVLSAAAALFIVLGFLTIVYKYLTRSLGTKSKLA